MSTQGATSPNIVKILWIAVTTLLSAVVGLIAGILVSWLGKDAAEALICGGAAFLGTLTLGLTILNMLWTQ